MSTFGCSTNVHYNHTAMGAKLASIVKSKKKQGFNIQKSMELIQAIEIDNKGEFFWII
jgi:hypothetical protein